MKAEILLGLLFLSLAFAASVHAVEVTVFVNTSVSNYPLDATNATQNSSWVVLAVSTTITSIDPSMIVSSNTTNSSAYAVLNLSDGEYYIAALHYNSTAEYATPIYLGTVMDNLTTIHILNTSNETSVSINDYANASAIRGYVKNTQGDGLNNAKVYFSGSYRGVSIPAIPATTRTFNGDGYYAIFLPLENASVNYTVTAKKSGYKGKSRVVTATKGFGSSAGDFINFTLSPIPTTVPEPYTPAPPAKPKAVILANSIDKALAGEFFGFLENQGIEISIANASEFEKYKTAKFLIILGGPDAYEGIGDIVKQLINETEQSFLRTKGNKKMITITNKFASGQVIHIIAGSDRYKTKEAWQENEQSVSAKITA